MEEAGKSEKEASDEEEEEKDEEEEEEVEQAETAAALGETDDTGELQEQSTTRSTLLLRDRGGSGASTSMSPRETRYQAPWEPGQGCTPDQHTKAFPPNLLKLL